MGQILENAYENEVSLYPKEAGLNTYNHIIRLLNHAEGLLATHDAVLACEYLTTALNILESHPKKLHNKECNRSGLAHWQKDKIENYIEAHIDSTIRVHDLCALVNLSQSHFTKAFKTSYGRAPSIYVAQQRIERAREKMLTSDYSLAQIALFYGFCDQAHFCRIFRRETGLSPKLWRRLHTGTRR